jgi:hypothetical protein
MGLSAGTAKLDITPAPGVGLLGYGAREGAARGVHDPLYARALALRSGQDQAASSVIIVVADLCLITPTQALEVRRDIAGRTGLAPANILVSCTHTHSGPDTGLAAQMTRREQPGHVAPLLQALSEAGERAYEGAAPARLRWLRAEAQIGKNRRRADGPVDTEIGVLEVQDVAGATRAVLYHYGCHPTVLGHDNLEISADWPGAASGAIERATGGTALFLLGAHADIDPRTRGLMDLAISGQSVGLGFDAVDVLGGEVAASVLGALRSPDPASDSPPIRAVSRSLHLPIHLGDQTEETARKQLESRKRQLAQMLGVPLADFPRLSNLEERIRERASGLDPATLRDRIAQGRLYIRDRTGPYWIEGARQLDVEAQLLRIGDAALLTLPVEPTTAVGMDWKTRTRRSLPYSGVVGIGNGWLRYLPHPDDLDDPLAHHRYEVLSSLLADGSCEKLLALGENLLEEVLSA